MKTLKWLLIATGAVLYSISAPGGMAYAQDPPASSPLFCMCRLSIAAGLEREVLRGYANDFAWRGVIPVAYNLLSPAPGTNGIRLSLTARASQAFDTSEQTELYLGARVTLWRGAP